MRSELACLTLGLVAALWLAGCDENKESADAEVNLHAAREAAEAGLRGTGGPGIVLRGVHAYRQARDGAAAICGQVNLQEGGTGSAYTLFVSVITPRDGRLEVEQHVATSGATASRVFVETVLRCYDEGGPPPGQRVGAPPPMPVVPDRLPVELRAVAPVAPAPRGAQPATQQVTLRQGGNLRVHPSGGGAPLRVVPAGTVLTVFEEAPGGWLKVGDKEPWGWMHNSLMR